MDDKTKELLRTFAEQLWERDTLTKSGCFGEESDAIDAALDMIEQQAARIAELEASLQASRRAALEELSRRIPTTPEQMIDFIGSNFDSMQADGWTDTLPSKPTGDLSMVRYSLTVHDLLSAFEWSDLSANAIRSLSGPTET